MIIFNNKSPLLLNYFIEIVKIDSYIQQYRSLVVLNLHIVQAKHFVFLEGTFSELASGTWVWVGMVRILQERSRQWVN